jgi:hypothetical protein
MDVAYEIKWQDPWEPFFISPRSAPGYDERFKQVRTSENSKDQEFLVNNPPYITRLIQPYTLVKLARIITRTVVKLTKKIRLPQGPNRVNFNIKRQFFSMSRFCNEKCSKPKIFLAFLSKLLCFSFIL